MDRLHKLIAEDKPPLIDTHCHLDFESFSKDREEVIERAHDAGVRAIIVPAIDLKNCASVIQLAEAYPSVYAAVGIHPNSSKEWRIDNLHDLKEFASHQKVVAIGEIGLDYYRDLSPMATQILAFRSQLRLAAELELPVIIHNRDADEDIMAILSDEASNDRASVGVLHSFSAGLEVAQLAVELGFFIGFTGPLTFRKSNELRNIAANLPLAQVLIETDAPFLSPEPQRGKRNEPGNVRYVAEMLAECNNLPFATLASQTTKNAQRLFKRMLNQ